MDGYPFEHLFQIHFHDDLGDFDSWSIFVKPHRAYDDDEYDKAWKGQESLAKMVEVMQLIIPGIAQDSSRMQELKDVLEFERNLTSILDSCTEEYNDECMEGAYSEGAQPWNDLLNSLFPLFFFSPHFLKVNFTFILCCKIGRVLLQQNI